MIRHLQHYIRLDWQVAGEHRPRSPNQWVVHGFEIMHMNFQDQIEMAAHPFWETLKGMERLKAEDAPWQAMDSAHKSIGKVTASIHHAIKNRMDVSANLH